MLGHWIEGRKLPPGMAPTDFFPQRLTNGSWSLSACRAWCDRAFKNQPTPLTNGHLKQVEFFDIEEEIKKAKLWRIQRENEDFEKENDRKWIETEVVANFVKLFGQWIGERVNRILEEPNGVRAAIQTQAAACGLTPEQLLALDSMMALALPALSDAFKADCSARGEELLEDLTKYRQAQIDKK